MPYYRRVGDVPRKRHLRVPHGSGFLFEELVGEEGFASDSALLYHRCSPSAILAVEAVDDPVDVALTPDHPLVPRHVRTGEVPRGGDPVLGRRRLLGNADLTISWVAADGSSALYRNAIGDELTYVQEGGAIVESSFGRLTVAAGDYVVVPRGVTQRWVVESRLDALVLEAAGHVTIPERYLTARTAAGGRAVLGARPPQSRRAARRRRRGGPRARAEPSRAVADGARPPPVRCRGVGRVPLPVRVQHR
jgi:homogentisate 1,2-dioxygenase